ncbi:MAG TPA: sensor histidine kinase [Aggregatilineales bacterium]|nr:sensor histidine kinase [Aggregatilineales bacterium]
MQNFFTLNRPLLLFAYGQTFFVMGLAIFLQSRRHSRLRLARDLRWLAAFGILHGLHEWGDVFIPIQASYLPQPVVELLLVFQVMLLAASFVCLMIFGAVALQPRWPRAGRLLALVVVAWALFFGIALLASPSFQDSFALGSTWARYLLGLPGSLVAAYGLRYQAENTVKPLGASRIYNTLRIAGFALLAYAVLGGLLVSSADYFPANVVNRDLIEGLSGVPVEAFRSLVGLALAVSIIRALEIFDLEVDRLIEDMEIGSIQIAERDRIGQEIHDGAIQGIYSASLILESMQPMLNGSKEAATRLDRAQHVLDDVITDLRRYIVSLRADSPGESLLTGIQKLVHDPRYSSLLDIQLKAEIDPTLQPYQTSHLLSVVQECLSNAIRHANARRVTVALHRAQEGLALSITDDGKGFDPDKVDLGYGVRAMRDRARLLGGTLNIEGSTGKGTTITLVMPEEAPL